MQSLCLNVLMNTDWKIWRRLWRKAHKKAPDKQGLTYSY